MAKFTLEFSENEILQVICALGAAHPMPPIMANKNEDPADAIGLCCKIFALMIAQTMRDTVPQGTPTGISGPAPEIAVPIAADAVGVTVHQEPVQPRPNTREYWAPKAKRNLAESIEFSPVKVDRKDVGDKKRLIVTGAGRTGSLTASCFEESLFGPIANRAKQPTLFYVTRSGKYINIVGLRG